MLSEMAHGMMYKDIFRFHRASPNLGQVIQGCEFNIKNANLILNFVISLLFGFINFFEIFYPENTISQDQDYFKDFNEANEILAKAIENHKRDNPRSHEFHFHMDKFINNIKLV